ncbi:hypothetical protein EY643_17225 [Halioglobus maricola]|uniref:Tetratricopeptide repeat protein n=1 Tax=Halioglobus maricola TaxID=2601894 RepID=A0A5P9NN60_9GAMM|nr:hypothetical protein [Halioglobus maricola]QFU77260.1 hypothetical protein EY643_17225 [Halioglobus maricola]
MSSFFSELKRRNVFRVAIAYLVLAWLVLQVTDLVAPPLGLPEWTMSMVIFLGSVGFPFALLFAWAFELTPEGLKRSEDVEPTESIAPHTGSRLKQVTTALLLSAVIILLLDRQLGLSERWQGEAALPEAGVEATVPPADESLSPDDGISLPRSIAVLPFVNMSDDASQEYFSDGISEELLNGLAKIRELRVAARTSSFAFKGKNQDISDIARQLKVDTVLEGSVRKAGQRVRITAQLINADDGYHLWSETYDRDLTDIFAVQDEISAAIVDALKIHLGTGPEMAVTRKTDVEAYNLVLQGRHSVRLRTKEGVEAGLEYYQRALEIDPDYAEAWAGLAIATSLMTANGLTDTPDDTYRLAQSYLDRAFALSPDLGDAHAGQALVYLNMERAEKGLESVDRALQINPSQGVLYLWKSHLLMQLLEWDKSLAVLEQAYLVDPLHPSIAVSRATRLADVGRGDEVLADLKPGSWMYYWIGLRVANSEARPASVYSLAEEGLAGDFNESQREIMRRLRFWAVYDGLYHDEYDLEDIPRHNAEMIQAGRDPQTVVARIGDRTFAELGEGDQHLLVFSLVRAQKCPDLVALLAPLRLELRHSDGIATSEHDEDAYAIELAWCLAETGERDRAHRLASRMMSSYRRSLDKGIPITWAGSSPVILSLAMGQPDEAFAYLEQLVATGTFSVRDFHVAPYFQAFAGRPEFEQLKAAVLHRANEQRAILGWPPRQDEGL